jgi:hypothetical protein
MSEKFSVIMDARLVKVETGETFMEVRRATPTMDASGAFAGFMYYDWERVPQEERKAEAVEQ